MSVNGMPAGKILGGLSRRKHVFSADRTIVFVLVLEALVSIEDTDRDAHAAFITMAKGFHTSYPTEATAVTVKGLLALPGQKRCSRKCMKNRLISQKRVD